MTDERIIECMADLDGITDAHYPSQRVSRRLMTWSTGVGVVPVPRYLNDLNACQRVLLGLSKTQQSDFCMYATEHGAVDGTQIAFDPPRVWCEAILKATGKWEAKQ